MAVAWVTVLRNSSLSYSVCFDEDRRDDKEQFADFIPKENLLSERYTRHLPPPPLSPLRIICLDHLDMLFDN